MDYTSVNGYVIDAQGRRQISNRDLANNVLGSDLDCTDLQNVINSLMYLIETKAGLVGDADDDTLVAKAIGKIVALALGAYVPTNTLTTFTSVSSSTLIDIPAWASRVELQVVGGGGAGASANAPTLSSESAYSGGGGGAGGFAWGIYAVSGGKQLTVTVGAGGQLEAAGGSSSVSYNGSTLLAANGGGGARFGVQGSSAGADGGTATGGTIANVTGNYGSDGQNGNNQLTGNGAAGPWGGNGRAGVAGGKDATGWGAGGGGTYAPPTTTRVWGGAGCQGVVLYRFLP
ncbi:hypothetical protein [Acetobacter sp.]|uniref:glycine-rich domain-containing protein n=1 Tax=Acetobacter sp. TaxID=440 RepID=UPI0039E7BF77